MALTLDRRETGRALDVALAQADEPAGNFRDAAHPCGAAGEPTLTVQTARFGDLDVEPELVITFPDGLIGFDRCRRFFVVRHEEGSAFRWLQSVEEPGLAFPVAEPDAIRPDYAPTVSDADARALGLTPDTPALLLTILTVPGDDPHAMTANLLGPLVINPLTRQGRQVIVQDPEFTTRHGVVAELQRAETLVKKAA